MRGSHCWRPGSDVTLGLGVMEALASLKEEQNIGDVKSPPSAERSLISFSAGGRISSKLTENMSAEKGCYWALFLLSEEKIVIKTALISTDSGLPSLSAPLERSLMTQQP